MTPEIKSLLAIIVFILAPIVLLLGIGYCITEKKIFKIPLAICLIVWLGILIFMSIYVDIGGN